MAVQSAGDSQGLCGQDHHPDLPEITCAGWRQLLWALDTAPGHALVLLLMQLPWQTVTGCPFTTGRHRGSVSIVQWFGLCRISEVGSTSQNTPSRQTPVILSDPGWMAKPWLPSLLSSFLTPMPLISGITDHLPKGLLPLTCLSQSFVLRKRNRNKDYWLLLVLQMKFSAF